MRKIRNPFKGLTGYNCFGCSPDNPAGLQMEFYEDGNELISEWTPKDHHQGYMNVLHGGIQSTLMDEIASWLVYVKLMRAGVTSNMEIRYFKPIFVNGGKLTIRAELKEMRKNLADIKVRILNSKNELCSQGNITYFTFSQEISKKSYNYPVNPEMF
ncbi:MAG: PaaI family thioesterase [Bacteroidota bacterium]|nr:PaaI family thioesterase [Bacteroidota bacterium]